MDEPDPLADLTPEQQAEAQQYLDQGLSREFARTMVTMRDLVLPPGMAPPTNWPLSAFE